MKKFILTLQLFAFASPVFAEISGDTFTEPKTGFEISKPKDWEFIKDPKTFGIELKDDKFTSKESGLIVTFSKVPKTPQSGVKPSVGVSRLKIPENQSLVHWLDEELKRQGQHDKYFVQASAAIATKMENGNGARAAFVNSALIQGKQARVYHTVYVVRSGKQAYLINMNCNDDQATEYVGAFGEIAGSIQTRAP